MLVGLQGAGKTTTCTKVPSSPPLLLDCIDGLARGTLSETGAQGSARLCGYVSRWSFRSTEAKRRQGSSTLLWLVRPSFPLLPSSDEEDRYTETDPVAIALEGVTKFRQERFDLIIVDTSGRHRQESDLFEEMVEIGRVVKPDSTIMVLDGAIGLSSPSPFDHCERKLIGG